MKAVEYQKNKEYVAQVIAQDEREKAQIKEKQQKHQTQLKEIAKFQRIQMGELPTAPQYNKDAGSVTTLNPKNKRNTQIDGPMNNEEIKMNKQLLQEIYELK